MILAFAVAGWVFLRRLHPRIANFFTVYAVLVTVAHLPFVMNTRIRIPFTDPLLVALGAGAWLRVSELVKLKHAHEQAATHDVPAISPL